MENKIIFVVKYLMLFAIFFNYASWIIPVIFLFFYLGFLKTICFIFLGLFVYCFWAAIIYPFLCLITNINVLLLKFLGKSCKRDMILVSISQAINIGFHLGLSFIVYKYVYATMLIDVFGITSGKMLLWRYYIVSLLVAYFFGVSGFQFLAMKERNNPNSNLMNNYMTFAFILMTLFSMFIVDYHVVQIIILIVFGFLPILFSALRDTYKDWHYRFWE